MSSSTDRPPLGPEVEAFQPAPDPVQPGWQENLFFILWDDSHDTGFLAHLQRVPERGEQEARVVVVVEGAVASATIVGPYGPTPVPGLDVDFVDPFRRLRVRLESSLTAGEGPLGLLTLTAGGDVPASVDLHLESDLPVVDFAGPLDAMVSQMATNAGGPQMGRQEHYEQGGRWQGSFRLGERRVSGQGLFVRDHSWGIRHERQDFKAFWTASCLDRGRVFCNAIGIPTGDRIVGIGAVADAEGVRFTTDVHARFRPEPGIASYDSVDVHFGAGIDTTLQSRTRRHVPIPLPHSGPGRYDNNAISSVLMEGKVGFGVMEWASTFTDAEARAVGLAQAAAGGPGE
ncbi:MAG: hypothetical protein M3Z03_07115 [Actinomycetota bacterium]|nr:hypothetical protein [Actinomycetota bacterium]